ncbi:hypothetical protein HMPREF1015_02748, partial [Bacillus smithii 7_3_47FAA]
YRRLEKGKFQWPNENDTGTIQISYRQLRWLLDGLAMEQKKAHPEVKARTVI